MDRVTVLLERRRDFHDPLAAGTILAVALHLSIVGAVIASRWIGSGPPKLAVAIPIRVISGGPAAPVPPRADRTETTEPPPALSSPPAPVPKVPRQKLEPPSPKPDPTKLADPTAMVKPKPQAPLAASRPDVPPAAPAAAPPSASNLPTIGAGAGPGFGFSTEGPALDEEDFQFPVYIQLMLQAIARNWYRPGVGETPGCTVYFRIGRTGHLIDWRMEISSGLPYFDRAAARAVQNAAPLPPLPADFGGPSLGVHLKFQ